MSAPTLERCTEALVESIAPGSWKLLSDESKAEFGKAARACIGAQWNYDMTAAPIDDWVILATTGEHVAEAIQYPDHSTQGSYWEWAIGGRLHENYKPIAWQHKPEPPTAVLGEKA